MHHSASSSFTQILQVVSHAFGHYLLVLSYKPEVGVVCGNATWNMLILLQQNGGAICHCYGKNTVFTFAAVEAATTTSLQ